MWLRRTVIFVSLGLVWFSRPVDAQVQPPGSIEIRLATDSDLERQGRSQLERILATYDLSRWFYPHGSDPIWGHSAQSPCPHVEHEQPHERHD